MKKRSLSLLLAIVMLLSLSTVAFADTTDNIPATIYQQCIDDTPAGCYIADITLTTEENITTVNTLYLPLAYVRGTVSDTETVTVWYNNSVLLLKYTLNATFSCNGTSASVTSSSFNLTYRRNLGDGYVVTANTPFTQNSNGSLAVAKGYGYYSATYNGSPIISNGCATAVIYCDAYGNLS